MAGQPKRTGAVCRAAAVGLLHLGCLVGMCAAAAVFAGGGAAGQAYTGAAVAAGLLLMLGSTLWLLRALPDAADRNGKEADKHEP